MSIESSSAPQSHKAVAGADHRSGKKTAKPDASSGDAASGFSALIDSLSAADTSATDALDTTLLPASDTAGIEKNVPDAQVNSGLVAINLMPVTADKKGDAALNPDGAAADLMVGGQGRIASASRGNGKSTVGGLSQSDDLAASVAANPGVDQIGAERTTKLQVDSLFGHRTALQSQNLSQVQAELREVKVHPAEVQLSASPTVVSTTALGSAADLLVQSQERPGVKRVSGQSGGGFEGAFGGMSGMASVRTDADYEVKAASAAVPDTSIAETVSYWVTHGVQSAELKLDGFGDKPVEVNIVLNGDQAQIDFRTDQADVRQVLEGATAHLKEMLSTEGLQLTGVSVGTSGGSGAQGEDRQPKPGAKSAIWKVNAPELPAVGRSANPSVGRTLDLFV
jgi:flagellar hook-length control protein FliK